MKKCNRCGELKPLDCFHNTSKKYTNAAGLKQVIKYKHAICKDCRNKIKREYNERKKIWK